jgi:hypothetical protein
MMIKTTMKICLFVLAGTTSGSSAQPEACSQLGQQACMSQASCEWRNGGRLGLGDCVNKDSSVTSATSSSSYVSLEASEDEGYVCCDGCPACSGSTNPPYAFCRGCNDDWMTTFVSLEANENEGFEYCEFHQTESACRSGGSCKWCWDAKCAPISGSCPGVFGVEKSASYLRAGQVKK